MSIFEPDYYTLDKASSLLSMDERLLLKRGIQQDIQLCVAFHEKPKGIFNKITLMMCCGEVIISPQNSSKSYKVSSL